MCFCRQVCRWWYRRGFHVLGTAVAVAVAVVACHSTSCFSSIARVQVVKELPPAPDALQVLWDLPTRSTKMPNSLNKARVLPETAAGK